MVDNEATAASGSAYVSGNVATGGGMFVGRDNILNVSIHVSGAKLQEITDTLFGLLAAPSVQIRANQVTAGEQSVALPPELVDALRQFLDATPGKTQAERERQYLLHLCVNPDFHQWQQRYVALSGGYRAVPELTPAYSTILVRGEGPQRQIERVPLADIRSALDKHAVFILLAQPGAGKTTVLQRLALDKALAVLSDEQPALTPLFVRLAAQGVAEAPLDFLARMWREAMPGGSVDAAAEVRDALRKGRLCVLVDALNEARSENYRERVHDWRDFAAGLPPGNQLVFSCRQLDYNGELAVQQVEIDPLRADQIQEFAVRYLGAAKGAAFWTALQARHADLLELATVPYYLHMLVDVYDGAGDLPAHRARLFAQFVRELFAREHRIRHPVAAIEPAAQHLALGELAYAMQTLGAGTQVAQDWALAQLPAQVRLPNGSDVATPPADVLAWLAHASHGDTYRLRRAMLRDIVL